MEVCGERKEQHKSMIYGVTHDKESNQVILRRSVTTKVAIGRGPDKTSNYPKKLDHFVFLMKADDGLNWIDDPDKTKHYIEKADGQDPTEVWIILLDDDIDQVFRTEYAWWAKTGKKCWGDGELATRRTNENPDGAAWEPCANHNCPQLESGDCKPSADLYFMLADFPSLGTVCRLHTSSYQSIRELYTALVDLKTMMGGRLMGLPVKLFVRPEKNVYGEGEQKKTGTKWILGLELSAESLPKMLESVSQSAKVFADLKKAMGGRRLEITEDDTDRAPEIASEFVSAAPRAQLPAPMDPEVGRKIEEFHATAEKAGLNKANRHMLLGKHDGNIESAMAELKTLAPAQPQSANESQPAAKTGKGSRKKTQDEPSATPLPAKPAEATKFDF